MSNDFDWFRPDDLPQLFDALRRAPQRGILVGGQSLTFWVDFLGIPIPDTGDPYLTQDADIYGTKATATFVARELGAEPYFPDLNDNTPNTAIVRYKTKDGRLLHLDFLGALVGLDEVEIIDTAVELDSQEYGRITVLHPRLVLQSRISNLYTLPNKRNGSGIAQAVVAVEMIAAFFDYYAANNPIPNTDRYYIQWFEWLYKLSLSKAGVYCYGHWEIDLMNASPEAKILYEAFHQKRLPQVRKYLAEKRRKFRG